MPPPDPPEVPPSHPAVPHADEPRESSRERAILHVDMDAFFAAIAQLDDPSLRGKPVLTGGTGNRGVVTTASYEARVFGCHSAMPMAQARRLCPHALCVHVPGERIRQCSSQLMQLLDSVTPLVQPVSVDEAYLDVTGSQRLLGPPETIAANLKRTIHETLGLTASIGVAANKFLAKLASDLDKPNGLTVIWPEDVDRVLPPLSVKKIPGIGPAAAERLRQRGIHTIADLRTYTQSPRRPAVGPQNPADPELTRLHALAHGLDARPVHTDSDAKSIGKEQTFSHNLTHRQQILDVMLGQAEEVGFRLRRKARHARGVTVKIRTGDFATVTRSLAFDRPTDLTAEMFDAGRTLFHHWADTRFRPVRLIGLTATPLTPPTGTVDQPHLFTEPARTRARRLDATVDAIRQRFGKGTLHRGGPI